MKLTHENKVEKFYSIGSDSRGFQEGGFLSFGYWIKGIKNYRQAVESLINQLLKFEKPIHSGTILNVACGYGAETLKIYEKLKPLKVIAIDITTAHVEFAKRQIKLLGLSDYISIEKKNACNLNYPPESFDYVIGIEGPAHFNTRETFLKKAYKVLKPGGILLLSDVIVNKATAEKNLYNKIIGAFCAKHWHMPEANWMSLNEIKTLLNKIGLKVNTIKSVGEYVYPGFSKYNLKWESIKNAMRTRGIKIGSALTFISWLLGHVHRRDMIDYVLIRAVKS